MENNYFKAAEVKLTRHITIPAEYIEEQFRRFNRYPMRQRSEAMADYILEMMKVQYYFTITTSEKNLLKKEIKKMFAGNNDLQIYKEFFVWVGKPNYLNYARTGCWNTLTWHLWHTCIWL